MNRSLSPLRRLLLASLLALGTAAHAAPENLAGEPPAPVNSTELEQRLQQLPWPDFKAVVSAIPKLKADVDAYGAFGWQYVQANYRTYHWARKIDRLDASQRRQLADLIRETQEKNRSQP